MATRSSDAELAKELLSALMASGEAMKYLIERADHRDLNIANLATTALNNWGIMRDFIVMALLTQNSPKATIVISYGEVDRPAIFLRFRKRKSSWRLSKAATKKVRGGRPWAWEVLIGPLGVIHFIKRKKRLIVEEEILCDNEVRRFNPILYQATRIFSVVKVPTTRS